MPSRKKKHANKRRNQNSRKAKNRSVRDKDVPFEKRCDIVTISTRLPAEPRNYHFTQLDGTVINPIVGSSSAAVTGSYYTLLSGLQNGTSFQSIFDQYRILAVDFVVKPRTNSVVVTGTSTPSPMYLVIDYDNSTALASASAATQFSSCAVVECYQSCRRVYKPRIAVAAYTGAFTGYENTSGWIDCAYNNVYHYGLKWYIPTCSVSLVPEWDIVARVHIVFRNVI